VCSSTEQGPETRAAEAVKERIAASGVGALGPAPLFRRQGRHRAQVVVKSRERGPAIAATRDAVDGVAGDRRNRGTSFAVDVDPQ
jgi:primosomal protein N' (replication factor Y)